MTELAYLSKKDVMSLFAIRDRTFYSWIEKELLHPMEVDGTKKYDVTKALRQKNIDPSDVNVLLAKPVQILNENQEALVVSSNTNNDENITQLKNQLEAINAELKDERQKNQMMISQFEMVESQKKLLIEFKDSENKIFELSKDRENKMVLSFQDKMKEIILSVQNNENGQYSKVLEALNETQAEREKGLKGTMKTGLISFSIIMIMIISGFAAVYLNQNEKMGKLENEKTELTNSYHNKELTLNNVYSLKEQKLISKGKDEVLQMTKEKQAALQKQSQENETKQNELMVNKEKKFAEDKSQLVKVFNDSIITLKSDLKEASKKGSRYRSDNDELKLQVKLLTMQMKNIIDKIGVNLETNEKQKDEKNVYLEKALKDIKDIQEGLKKLNDKEKPKILEDSVE